jgi:hypothetical protein
MTAGTSSAGCACARPGLTLTPEDSAARDNY